MDSNDLPPPYEPKHSPEISNPSHTPAIKFDRDGKKHVLLAATGSTVAVNVKDIVRALEARSDITLRLLLTAAAKRFFSNGTDSDEVSAESLNHLPQVEAVYIDGEEEQELYAELRSWVDILVVAPCDADTLAKMTNGIADNLLLSVLRAWDPEGKLNPPVRMNRGKFLLLAPAMDTAQWKHPVTKKQLQILESEWADYREFSKGPSRNRDEELSNVSVRDEPWARIVRPKADELMDWKNVTKAIVSLVDEFN